MPFEKTIRVLGATLVGALSLSSCQFGNKNTTELHGYDTISGYYSTLPQTITFHAEVGSGPARDQNGLVNQMPDFLKTVMANPAMLYYDDPLKSYGSIRAHSNTGLGIPTVISDHLSTYGASSSASVTVSGCKLEEDTTHTGKFSQAATTSTIAGLTVRGNLSMDYAITYSLIGQDVDCDAMRATFKSCYIDGTGCSTDPASIFYRAFVTQIFAPFVNVGIITDAEIGNVRSVTYRATYQ
jgi:hypothetical protein